MAAVGERNHPGNDRFSIIRRLGEGSFGVVYEARDRKRNATIALKTLSRVEPAALARFKREFRALADMTHPNLVVLHELFSDGEQWFFSMELVDGVHMLEYVQEGGSTRPSAFDLSPGADTADYTRTDPSDEPTMIRAHSRPALAPLISYDRLRHAFAQLAEGVVALHQAGMLHRDIKPSNVMVTREGRVVLLDFGLVAELEADVTQTFHIVGTPSYMSPEQAAGQPVTEASDWYSVGSMLYQALVGRLPFTGKMIEILNAKQSLEPLPPASITLDIPTGLNDLCCDLLRRDPAMRPSGRDVISRLRELDGEARRRAPTRVRRSGVFLGRERHLQILDEAYQAVRRGRPVTMFVHGLSGMGKTALVRRFLDEIEDRDSDSVVLTGRCYERESVPYKAIDNLIDSLTSHLRKLPDEDVDRLLPRHILALARLFPVLRNVPAVNSARRRVPDIPDSQEQRRRAFSALRELLARMGENNPLVLYVDDVQWGDLDSGALLEELLRPPDAPAMMLIASYRSEEVVASSLLQRLIEFRKRAGADMDTRELSVGELPHTDACAVARALIGERVPGAEALAEIIARESSGSPFFVEELARFHRESEEESWSRVTLGEVIHQRVSRLPEESRNLLEVVAVAGQPVDRHVARNAANLRRDDHAALGLLRSAHLLRVLGSDQVVIYHDRIREAVSSGLPPERTQALHHRLALAWEAVGADPETLALHFHSAGEMDRAAQYAVVAAARAAEALAFDRAARLYRMALDLRPEESRRRGDLEIALGDALANAGRGAEAAKAYQAAAETAEPALAIDLQRRAAEQLLFAGHIDEGRAAARRVLARVGMHMAATPRRALVSLLYHRARLRLRGFEFHERQTEEIPSEDLLRIDTCCSLSLVLGLYDVIAGLDFHARHLLLALNAGEPGRVAQALAAEVAYSATAGTRTRVHTAKLQRIAEDLVARVRNPHALGLLQLRTGTVAFLEARFCEGGELLERAESIFREQCTGVICELDTSVIFWMFCKCHMGDWVNLSPRVSALLKDANERGDLYASVAIRARILCLLHLVADDPGRARDEEREVRKYCSPVGFESPHYWSWLARTETALYAGRMEEAWAEVEQQWPNFTGSLLTRVQMVYIESRHLRARCALAVGRSDEAEREARIIERERSPWGNALAQLIRAALAVDRGDRAGALAMTNEAEKFFLKARILHYAAAARRSRGSLLQGEQGRELTRSADADMAAQLIRNPERMSALLAPGKWQALD